MAKQVCSQEICSTASCLVKSLQALASALGAAKKQKARSRPSLLTHLEAPCVSSTGVGYH